MVTRHDAPLDMGRRPTRFWMASGFFVLVCARPVAGQVFELRGGSSSLFDAHGASVEFHEHNYFGRVDIGSVNEPRLGLFLGFRYRGINWGLGDQTIPFVLPTDLFDRSYYFVGRGLSASRKDGRSNLLIFGGATSTSFTTPFLNVAQPDQGAGLVFYERQISASVRFSSYDLFSSRQTSIQSLEWKARKDLRLAVSSGIGNNQAYWVSSLDFDRNWILLQGSYGRAGDNFRRIRVDTPLVAETSRENIRLTLVPLENLRFVMGRQNFLCPLATQACQTRATVNSLGVSASAGGFNFHGSFFDSSNQAGTSKASSLGIRRRLNGRIDAGVEYLRVRPSVGGTTQTVVTTIREILTRRLSLSQVVTHSGGQTSVAYGGSFTSNTLTLGVDYQTIFLPFAQQPTSPFKQFLTVNLRLQLPWDTQFNGTSDVDPLGNVRYTGYANTVLYRQHDGDGSSARKLSVYTNIVRGRVVDQNGEPIFGAALRVDGELVFTNSQGMFFVRRKKPKELRLEALLDQFMFPGVYRPVLVPRTVRAAPEETNEMNEVVIGRYP